MTHEEDRRTQAHRIDDGLQLLGIHTRRAREQGGDYAARYTAAAGDHARRLLHAQHVTSTGPDAIDQIATADAAWRAWLDEVGIDCEQCATAPATRHVCRKRNQP